MALDRDGLQKLLKETAGRAEGQLKVRSAARHMEAWQEGQERASQGGLADGPV